MIKKMNSPYFREGYHYYFKYLKEAFGIDNDAKIQKDLNILKEHGVLKIIPRDRIQYEDLSEQEIIFEDTDVNPDRNVYIFNFVGVILLDDIVIKCYPKYIDCAEPDKHKKELFEKLKQVIRVIEKYNSKEQFVHLYNGGVTSKAFFKLSISLNILYDYFENGLYSNQQQIIETNGEGEILWDKTIDESFAYIQNNTPYYFELKTVVSTQNEQDFIRRLHAAIITQCSKDLDHADLLQLFGISGAEISDESIEDLGDIDYLKYKIESELRNQFITRKQNLLKTLYTYISKKGAIESDYSFSLFGTTAFNLVWENACGSLFNDIYKKNYTLGRLASEGLISKDLISKNDINIKLSDVIERPEWIMGNKKLDYMGNLILDILTIKNNSLYILDGKYYLLDVKDGKLTGNPGIQDVVKQYVYNSALQNFIDKFKIKGVANAFLVPALYSDSSHIDSISQIGEVPYWSVQRAGFKELPATQIIKIKPELVWENYLTNSILKDDLWKCITVSPTRNYLYSNQFDNKSGMPIIDNDQKNIVVGFLREKYFNFVKDKDNFIFYFYSTTDTVRYPLHPCIDSCTEFIGYTVDKTLYINGKLELLESGRCRIDEIQANVLKSLLSDRGFEKGNSSGSIQPRTYYKMIVRDVKITNQPYNGLPDFEALKRMISMEGLNQVLFKASPKVIHV